MKYKSNIASQNTPLPSLQHDDGWFRNIHRLFADRAFGFLTLCTVAPTLNEQHRQNMETGINYMTDMLSACLEDSIIFSRILKEPCSLVRQILQYRDDIRLLYSTN